MHSCGRNALVVALLALPIGAVAGWSEKPLPGRQGVVGCEDGSVKTDGNGKVVSCTLHDLTKFGSVICLGGKNIAFHPNGRVKSCTMHDAHDFPGVGRCVRGQVLTLTDQGKALSCR